MTSLRFWKLLHLQVAKVDGHAFIAVELEADRPLVLGVFGSGSHHMNPVEPRVVFRTHRYDPQGVPLIDPQQVLHPLDPLFLLGLNGISLARDIRRGRHVPPERS